MFGSRDIQILLVEPDEGEARRTAATLKRSKIHNHVTVAKNGGEAMTHLRASNHYRSPRPSLILLSADHLPDHGEELLNTVKGDAKLGHIPVVFMSSSAREGDITRAYDLAANCYVQKPASEQELERVLETIREFWLSIVKLPND